MAGRTAIQANPPGFAIQRRRQRRRIRRIDTDGGLGMAAVERVIGRSAPIAGTFLEPRGAYAKDELWPRGQPYSVRSHGADQQQNRRDELTAPEMPDSEPSAGQPNRSRAGHAGTPSEARPDRRGMPKKSPYGVSPSYSPPHAPAAASGTVAPTTLSESSTGTGALPAHAVALPQVHRLPSFEVAERLRRAVGPAHPDVANRGSRSQA